MQHIWIFQLATSPSTTIKAMLLPQLDAFMETWKAHGAPVPGHARLLHDRFVVVQAEPGHASGCSIDSMTKGVTEILAQHGLEALGADRIFFREQDGSIAHIDFKEAKAALLSGRMNAQTTVFDSTLGNAHQLEQWEVPLEKTWLKRFLPAAAEAKS